MHDLEIAWPGGEARFSPEDSPVLIGRSSSAAVIVPQGTVSRRHLTMSWNGQSWTAEDTSTHGSFDPIGVRLAPTWTVGTDLVIRLGSPRGVELSMRLITTTFDDQAAFLDPYADPESPPTIVDFGPPPPLNESGGMLHIPDSPPPNVDGDPLRSPSISDFLQQEQQPVGADQGDLSHFVEASSEGGSIEGQTLVESDPGPVSPEEPAAEAVVDFTGAEPVIELGGDESVGLADRPSWQPAESSPFPAGFPASQDLEPIPGDPAVPEEDFEPRAAPAATFVETDTLRLQLDGEDYVYLPGHEVTVGRDPTCVVVVDERHALVSRRHLRFVHTDGGWWLEDQSSKGTFVDGRRLSRPYQAEGAFIAHLGDQAAGTQLRIVTAGQHRRPTNRAGLAIGAVAAAALVLAALAAWFVFRGDAEDAATLTAAKKSTVMLLSESGHGSGFFVSDSMILTNQHVAAMADQLVVAVSPEEDEPAQIQYVAGLVENHPFLDVAVVKISNRAEINEAGSVNIGDTVDSADIPILRLGDSSAVTLGDEITSTGFPGRFTVSSADDAGQLRLAPVSTTSGQAANFTPWPGCSTPDLSSFIPADAPPTVTCAADGNIEKGVLLASFPSGQGASGSAVIHEDKVVAVVFAGDAQDSNVSRSITTNAFSSWLSGVLAEND